MKKILFVMLTVSALSGHATEQVTGAACVLRDSDDLETELAVLDAEEQCAGEVERLSEWKTWFSYPPRGTIYGHALVSRCVSARFKCLN